MMLEEVKAKYRRVADEAFNKGNLNAWNEILSPDVVFYESSMPPVKGLEAYKQAGMAMVQGFSDISFVLTELLAENNITAVRYSMSMKHTGTSPMAPVPATGKEVVITGGVQHRWSNGKIVEITAFCDLLGFLQQLGMVPPMGQK